METTLPPGPPGRARMETILAQLGRRADDVAHRAVSVPIYQTATFAHMDFQRGRGYDYSRTSNPTRTVLEEAICELDGGARGSAFTSGMAAITTVLALFRQGDEILFGEHLYGGTYRLCRESLSLQGIRFRFVPTDEPDAVADAVGPDTRALFCETPSNPLLRVSDLRALSEVARRRNLLFLVDNTFLTPFLQRPIDLGADITIYSATKYLAGHDDVVAGLVVAKDAELGARIARLQNNLGTALGPFDAWLTLRGMKTLALRMRAQEKSALTVAAFLHDHPAVEQVYYPGLADDPGHEVTRGQADGFGATLSFRLRNEDRAEAFIGALRLATYAESLGGTETLVTHPANQTHRDLSPSERERLGFTDGLLRLSVGAEAVEDILADLDRALAVTEVHQTAR